MLQVYRVFFTILPNKNNFRSVLYLLWTWLELEHNSSLTTLKIKRSNHRQLRMEKGKKQHQKEQWKGDFIPLQGSNLEKIHGKGRAAMQWHQ